MRIKTLFYDKNSIDYDGSQLRSGWINEELNISGNAAVSFRGKCDVKKEFMVDLEDLKNNETIFSNDMLHFLIEIDERDLEKIVLRQIIVISIIKETIEKLNENLKIRREGDDLFILKKTGYKKITVSVATLSPASSLIHVGINIISEGIPVPAIGLEEIGVDYKKVAGIVLEKIKKEFIDVENSTLKVKLVT